MPINNHVNHGITLSESSPSQTYSYSVVETTENEPLHVPSINGDTCIGGGATITLEGSSSMTYSLTSFSCVDVNNVTWTLQNELTPDGYYQLWLTHGSTREMYEGGSGQMHTFGIYITVDGYDPATDTYTGRPSYVKAAGYGGSYLGCTVEITADSLPQVKRTYAVTES